MRKRQTRNLIDDMSETVKDYEKLKSWWNEHQTLIQKKKAIKKEEKKNVKVY